MSSRKNITVGLIIGALGIAALIPLPASARDATGRMHFHPFTFIDVRVASADATATATSTDIVDHVVCPVRGVLTPQGNRLLEACD